MPHGESLDPVRAAVRWAGALALALGVLSFLLARGATTGIDNLVLKPAQSIASYPLDVAATLVSIVGRSEVTGPLALLLAFMWWRRRGVRGLVPLLLFAGVALEVALKHLLPHPGPPPEVSRNLHLVPLFRPASLSSFPSGHMLSTTFLAALVCERPVFWALTTAMAATGLYLGEHWASDVVGGALLGLALAGVAAAIYGGGRQTQR